MKPWQPPSWDAPADKAEALAQARAAWAQPFEAVRAPTALEAVAPQAHPQAFLRGLQQGLEEGRTQGLALGRQEGWSEGHRQGHEAGLSQGLQEAASDVQRLTDSLQGLVDSLQAFPAIWAEELGELVFMLASKLNAGVQPDRSLVMHAVLDALQAMPKPGHTLTLRVAPSELATWASLLNDPQAPSNMAALADAELSPGQAMIELGSSRIDVGDGARLALLKSALSLLPRPQPSD